MLTDFLERLNHSAIVWARFRKDVDLLINVLGDRACRYDGSLTDEECEQSKNAFNAGDKQFFVGTPAKGARGLTLNIAKSVVFYSNDFRLRNRLQAEDRCHRYGQGGAEHEGYGHGVLYCDIIGQGSVGRTDYRMFTIKERYCCPFVGG